MVIQYYNARNLVGNKHTIMLIYTSLTIYSVKAYILHKDYVKLFNNIVYITK